MSVNTSASAEVSTGDKIMGKLKEAAGSVIGDKDLKAEGKAVHKAEKDAEKVDEHEKKVLKQNDKVAEHQATAGVADASNVTLGEKLVGGIKANVGAAIGDKDMKKEGEAVHKTEKEHAKLEKEAGKLDKKEDDLLKHKTQADIHH
eukprot:TRINITY_DN204_c0_g1_i1.p1 TRINITY_DN204_c0_g1~~TRINITY_DN204_c0_g1_i1.p1  ORF type:complete len:146 (+),score=70.12 TRINITY_DN204_c0_g1_i1:85-522(+)